MLVSGATLAHMAASAVCIRGGGLEAQKGALDSVARTFVSFVLMGGTVMCPSGGFLPRIGAPCFLFRLSKLSRVLAWRGART